MNIKYLHYNFYSLNVEKIELEKPSSSGLSIRSQMDNNAMPKIAK